MPRQATTLQQAYERVAIDIEEIEALAGRERAVALDLAQRRLRRAIEANRDLLAEWDLAA